MHLRVQYSYFASIKSRTTSRLFFRRTHCSVGFLKNPLFWLILSKKYICEILVLSGGYVSIHFYELLSLTFFDICSAQVFWQLTYSLKHNMSRKLKVYLYTPLRVSFNRIFLKILLCIKVFMSYMVFPVFDFPGP